MSTVIRQGTFDQPEPSVAATEGGADPYAATGPKSGGAAPRKTPGAKPPGATPTPRKAGKPVTRNNPFPPAATPTVPANNAPTTATSVTGGKKGGDGKLKTKPTVYRKEDTAYNRGTAKPVTSKTNKTMADKNKSGGTNGDDKGRDALEDIGKNFIDHVEKTEKDNADLQKENIQLKDQIKDLEKENKQLHADNKQTHQEMVNMRDQVQAKTDQVGKLQEDLKIAQKNDLHKKVKKLEDENNNLKATLKTTAEEDKKLTSDCDLLRSQVNSLKKATDDLESQLKVAKDKLANTEKTKDTKEKDLQNKLDSDNKSLGGEISKLKQEIGDKDKKYQQMELKFKAREKELKADVETNENKYVTVIQEMERQIAKLKGELSKIKQERDKLLQQNEKLVREQSEKLKSMINKDQLSELQQANKKAVMQKDKCERELAKVRKEFEAYKKDIQRKESEQAFTQVKTNDLTEKVKQLKASLSSMTNLLQEREGHIADLRIEVNDLRNNCHAFQKELTTLRGRHDDDVTYDKYNDMQSAHKKLLDENKHLRTVVARTSMEETNTASERAELRADYERTKEKLVKAQERIKQMEKWMDEIFRDDKFDVVLKLGDTSRASVSFPDIALSEPPPTSRGHPGNVSRGSLGGAATQGNKKKQTARKDTYQPPGKLARRDNNVSPTKTTLGKHH